MKRKFKLHAPLKGLPIGSTVMLAVDRKGVPVEGYWRSRFLDSRYDDCLEKIVEDVGNKHKKKEKTEKQQKSE